METRKIISFGSSSYVVSVPKSWIEGNKLKKGDILTLEEKQGELLLYPGQNDRKKEPKHIRIAIDDKDIGLVTTEIVSAYLNGYDTIEITGSIEKNAPEIKAALRNLSGLEIIQQDATKIVAQDLLNIEEISIITLIRRADNIVRSMLIDSVKSIYHDHYNEIAERDLDVNRLVYLAYRVIRAAMMDPRLAKKLGKSSFELMTDWIIMSKLEKVGDKSKRVARYLAKANLRNEDEKKKLEKIHEEIKQAYFDAMTAYYKKDMRKALEIENTHLKRINKCNDFVKERQNAYTHMIIEQLKSLSASVRYIARGLLGIGVE
ncbi:MAG: phosphate uptake regulator PhoU [Candidatus Woesearchaeota archaeon]